MLGQLGSVLGTSQKLNDPPTAHPCSESTKSMPLNSLDIWNDAVLLANCVVQCPPPSEVWTIEELHVVVPQDPPAAQPYCVSTNLTANSWAVVPLDCCDQLGEKVGTLPTRSEPPRDVVK